MSLKTRINSVPWLKKLIHWCIVVPGRARPRAWLRVIPRLIHRIAWSACLDGRLDVFPFNRFSLDARSVLELNSVVNNGVGDVIIGKKVTLGIGSVVIGPVKIGDNVIIAQYVVISGLNHRYSDIEMPISEQGVDIEQIEISDNCWIGANVAIRSGVHIGRNCVIGAGSVVLNDVPDYTLAVGNPARPVKKYCFNTGDWIKV